MNVSCFRPVLCRALPPLFHVALFTLATLAVPGGLRADDDYGNIGNPTGNAGQFNGNVSSGGSYDPLTANAMRTVTDLVVPGSVGAYPLVFSRTANSRFVGGLQSLFGEGGNWRHNFQYELRVSGNAGGMLLTYPDGRNVTFNPLAATDPRYVDASPKPPSTLLYGTPGIRDRLDKALVDAFHPVLRLADGGQVQFEYYIPAGTSTPAFRAILITDPFGQSTLLQYWTTDSESVRYVIEPGGRWLLVDYLPPYAGAQKVAISSVTAWNGQRVTYNYGQITQPVGSPYVVLTAAVYAYEPTAANPSAFVTATYEYFNDIVNGAPLLMRCYDPHFAGPMWGIFYTYDNSRGAIGGWGRVSQELHPTSGAVLTTLSIPLGSDGKNLHDEFGGKVRQETRGDRADDGTGNSYPLVRSFGYDNGTNFLHYVTDYANDYANDYTHGREVYIHDAYGYLQSVNTRRNFQTTFVNEPHIGQIKQITLPPDQNSVSHHRNFTYSDSLHPYYRASAGEQAGSNPDPNSADWRTTFYDRDSRNRVWRIRYPDGGYEQFVFDDSDTGCGQVTAHRLVSGGTVSYVYGRSAANTRGLLLSKTENDGVAWNFTTTYGYDALDRLQTVTDARQNQTVFAYNARHQIVRVTHPQDPARQRYPDGQNGTNYSTFTYDDQGNRLTATDECSHTTTVTYDQYRRPVLSQDALGHAVFLSYERRRKNGQVVANADTHNRATWTTMMQPSYADGARFKHAFRAYDPFFRLVSETAGLGGTDGNWPNVVSGGDSVRSDLSYDVDGNLISANDASGRFTTYEVDQRGRRTSMTLPADGQFNRKSSYTFDGVGNLLQETRPDGGGSFLYTYDAMNRRSSVTDPANHVTRTDFAYKVNNNGAGGTTLTTTDPKLNVYVHHADGLGRQVKMAYPASTLEYWHYDQAGNVDTFTNRAGQVRTTTYDNRNWPTQRAWNTGGRTVNFTYYSDGRVLYALTDAGNYLCFWRDATGKVLTEKQSPDAGLPWADVTSAYDDDSSRTSLAYPGGDSLLLRYDDAGRTAREYFNNPQTAFVANVFNPDGSPARRLRASQLHTGYTFDAGARLSSVNLFLGTPSAPRGGISYGYDALTRRVWAQRQEDGRGDLFHYQADDQLWLGEQEATGVSTGTASNLGRRYGFAYDEAGNRTASDDSTQTNGHVNYAVDTLNRYYLNGTGSGYDANSNFSWDPLSGASYFYDADNRLTRAYNPQTGTDRYFGYDALGRNVWWRDGNGAKTYLLYDGANLIEERGGTGGTFSTVIKRYAHGTGTDEPLIMVQANGTGLYYHQDANGNVVALSDTAGNVVERYHYSPFGTPLVCDASGTENRGDASLYGNRFLFTGREWHAGLKLYNYRARFYSPGLGRFLQTDPIGFGGGNHLYRYGGNNPTNNVDPSGLGFFSTVLHFLDGGGSSNGISPGDRPLTGSSIPGTASINQVTIYPGAGFRPGVSDRVNQGSGGAGSTSDQTTARQSAIEVALPSGDSELEDYSVAGVAGILTTEDKAAKAADKYQIPIFFVPSKGFLLDALNGALDNLTFGHYTSASSDLISAVSLLTPDADSGNITLYGHSYGSEVIVNTAFNGGLPVGTDVHLYSSPVNIITSYASLAASGVHVRDYSLNGFDIANLYSPSLNPMNIIGTLGIGLFNVGGNHGNYPFNGRGP